MQSNLKFIKALNGKILEKSKIETLQINLGKKCNLTCSHCHVEAGPHRTEELEEEALQDILRIIEKFPEIKTVDLTGWAPEMNNGFRKIAEKAQSLGKKVIVRTNLTVFFEEWYEYLPEYFAQHKYELVASLPCYLEDNVDKMRWDGVYEKSIKALQLLNKFWYGKDSDLIINLVYNTAITEDKNKFALAPDQMKLEWDYKKFLDEEFGIQFNNLFAFTNIPCGRLKKYLQVKHIYDDYVDFLRDAYNPDTLWNLMCKTQLSIDYLWNIYDCDFNQVEWVPAIWKKGKKLVLKDILEESSLNIIKNIMVRDYCFWCTAWAGSSCGGALS